MNVIFLSNFCRRKNCFHIGLKQLIALLLAGSALLGGGLFWAGYQVAMAYSVEDPATTELRQMLNEERALLHSTQSEARTQLDALALRIGGLRAHMMRLDALGQRLVSIGKLDAGEFDFQAEPPLGGVSAADEGHSQSAADLTEEMDRITALLEDREYKLDLLEGLLLDRELGREVKPSGRPVNQGWISSSFGKRTDPFSGKNKFHRGIDFAGKPGADVVAVAAGIVIRAEKAPDYGNLIEIRHPDGYTTRYAHNQENLVNEGDMVDKGQVIALLGSSGRSNGPHVHFEVHKDGRVVNPRKYVNAH